MLVNTTLSGKEVTIYGGTLSFDTEGKAKDVKDEVAIRFKDLPGFEYTAPRKKAEPKTKVEPKVEEEPVVDAEPKPKTKTKSKTATK